MQKRHFFARLASLGVLALAAAVLPAMAQSTQAPDALVKQVSNEVIDAVKADKAIQGGDTTRILAVVDA